LSRTLQRESGGGRKREKRRGRQKHFDELTGNGRKHREELTWREWISRVGTVIRYQARQVQTKTPSCIKAKLVT
jgi:hypothetical protein